MGAHTQKGNVMAGTPTVPKMAPMVGVVSAHMTAQYAANATHGQLMTKNMAPTVMAPSTEL